MDVEFFIVACLLMMAMIVIFGIYSLLFEWLPEYLRRRKATATERAIEWVNTHPIKPRGRKR